MKPIAFFLLSAITLSSHTQNLPSLLTGRNINATFSITAYDSTAQEWGIAVATNNIYVGNSTVYIEPGLGAFSVIAETEPAYAYNGFDQLRQGKSIREAIGYTSKTDSLVYLRQVAGIDRYGNTFAFTGASWKYQKGFAGSLAGPHYVVMGNQLAPEVLSRMSAAFTATTGTLAQRLLAAIVAGQKAGGQITGKQSAALVVKGPNNIWFNNIDLRVDDSRDPFGDLTRLLNYHYGRIRTNQATYAIRMGNRPRALLLLQQADSLTRGWNGLQSKIALAWLLLHENAKAVATIRAAIHENPQWKENIPAFYVLRNEPGMQEYFKGRTFTEKDWIAALDLFDQLDRPLEEEALCRKALLQFPASSYLYYLLAQSLRAQTKTADAKLALQQAVKLDPENAEAVVLLATMP